MGKGLEDLAILRKAEAICDEIWEEVRGWERFNRETVGSQLLRAADSMGANIAESHGRFHYGEKVQFLYYSRGSQFETLYWLRRCANRSLMEATKLTKLHSQIDDLSRDTNAYINYLRRQRSRGRQGGV